MPLRSIFRQVTLGADAPALGASQATRAPGDSARSASPTLNARFAALLGVLRPSAARPSLLDLGCGPGLLLDHLRAAGRDRAIDYTGVDLSPSLLEPAAQLWPEARFFRRDIFEAPFSERSFDYVIVNGLPLEGAAAREAERAAHARRLIETSFRFCRIGIAFDLAIGLPDGSGDAPGAPLHDALLMFVTAHVTRHVVLRGDCGLPCHTVYLYREPSR